ncbi:MAG: glycerophosphodiester phosphodiesterase [Oscillospiraceae bacterium]|nr:glycerophosphodiester phosphodiesterase [Oscillospiraceae bacterium]
MTALYCFAGILLALCILYILALRCRRGHKTLAALQGWSYAHRGLHGNGVPENSMEAFRLALEGGYGIELDVHLMKDGQLAVIHDPSLKRTAGADVLIEDLTAEDLPKYPLEGTQEQIPLFSDVLALYDGKAPIIVELKAERGNHAALAEAVCNLLGDYKGVYCLESFDPRVVHWLRKNRRCLCRGQLAENFLNNKKSKLPMFLKFVLTHQLENFLVFPDFVAYKFADRKNLGVWLARNIWGVQGVTWTVTSQADYDVAVAEGWIPIFEGFRP